MVQIEGWLWGCDKLSSVLIQFLISGALSSALKLGGAFGWYGIRLWQWGEHNCMHLSVCFMQSGFTVAQSEWPLSGGAILTGELWMETWLVYGWGGEIV